MLADRMIALLFCWHTQQRSVIGFITMICGTSCRQSLQKVVYAAALTLASSAESLYCTQTAYCVQVRDHVYIHYIQSTSRVLLSHSPTAVVHVCLVHVGCMWSRSHTTQCATMYYCMYTCVFRRIPSLLCWKAVIGGRLAYSQEFGQGGGWHSPRRNWIRR